MVAPVADVLRILIDAPVFGTQHSAPEILLLHYYRTSVGVRLCHSFIVFVRASLLFWDPVFLVQLCCDVDVTCFSTGSLCGMQDISVFISAFLCVLL